ncbi:M48 family metallopeptidase [Sinomicrobium soli]|uniref:M48 family metallopeptidase n=1 Tax=Sinomicrobium sp. N-1-3-6 TaxID=2219864 RepID=UPI000DCD4E29|nr:M48 family metallopeptidase [Sinomicrobium sp. N-1-3-6]RAV29987.1 M48 family peptidase [Sinomicrobium sp. N-1-3-6]
MEPTTLSYIITGILILDFAIDQVLDYLNARHFNDPVPPLLDDVYDSDKYKRSQEYKKENYRFSIVSSACSLLITLGFLYAGGFEFTDQVARGISDNDIVIALLFFGMILLASDVISMPFTWYHTFVIEEKYGFNKTTPATFFTDKLKGWLMGAVFGGGIMALVIWFYQLTGRHFWLYAWGAVTFFSILVNMFYSRLIVPLFNKQTPLEEGTLKTAIEAYASKAGFTLNNIFVIDGSRRSTKANAYFSGFGREKRITLYDTLVKDLDTEEIVAVLAHEVGHYKRKHILFNLAVSTGLTGLTLYVLSLCINFPELSYALGVSQHGFHTGLIAFGILYSPVSEITGMVMNYVSRKFEYQADNYARDTYAAPPLVSALKKLSRNNLGNLTPHPAYVKVHYSHPTLLQRVQNLQFYRPKA